ncbi:MAG: peptidoglycan-binding protein LysM [Thermoanaerobaculia bacterium]
MGLFDFVKNAGASIFGKDDKTSAAPAGPQTHTVSPAELDAMKRRKALEKLLGELSLEVEELKIDVTGDIATVHGLVDDQAEREKVVLALGNVIGIARVDDRLETKKKAAESQMYTVVAGDSLSKIAKHFYGNAAKYNAIFEANKPMLKDPDKIYPGQVLRIPPAE